MPVPVTNQRIHDEHIPKSLCDYLAVNGLLLLKGVENIGQFRSVSVSLRVDDLVFQRCEILQGDPWLRKVPTGYYDFRFPFDRVGSQHGFLHRDTNALIDLAAEIFGETAIAITHLFIF